MWTSKSDEEDPVRESADVRLYTVAPWQTHRLTLGRTVSNVRCETEDDIEDRSRDTALGTHQYHTIDAVHTTYTRIGACQCGPAS